MSYLHDIFEHQVRRCPHRIAVRYQDQVLSYEQVNQKANKIARALLAHKVTPGTHVGFITDRGFNIVIGILALLKVGATYVPLDPNAPIERLRFILEDAKISILLGEEVFYSKLSHPSLNMVDLNGDYAGFSTDNPRLSLPETLLAYIIYTSGTTGKPKGVMVTHQNIVNLLRSTKTLFNFNDQDRWTLFHSFAFDFSVWEMWGALFYGSEVVIVPYLMACSPEKFFDFIIKNKITVLNQTPSAFQEIIKHIQDKQQTDKQIQQSPIFLRYIIFGGEALYPQTLRPWLKHFGCQQPQLINMYGITETTVHATFYRLTQDDIEKGKESIIGKPLPGWEIFLLDEALKLVEVGNLGEMYIGGQGVAEGYWNQPLLTAQRFITYNFQKVYRSGDVAKITAQGDLVYGGRLDQQVKIRGYRIELGEIETCLKNLPGILDAVMVAKSGDGGEISLLAFVILDSQHTLTSSQIIEQLRQFLPAYMIPQHIFYCEHFPLTINGKIDKQELLKIMPINNRLGKEKISPRNDIEQSLYDIFCAVLKVKDFCMFDNFFLIGVDSLLAAHAVHQIFEKFSVAVTIADLFAYPTLASFAAWFTQARVNQKIEKTAPSIEVNKTSIVPLLPIQYQFLFFQELFPDQPIYNECLSFRMAGNITRELLAESLGFLIQRHEALRSYVDYVNGQPCFQINNDLLWQLEELDLTQHVEADHQQMIEAFQSKLTHPFSLNHAPLWRIGYIRITDVESRLYWVIHHVIIDGESRNILLKELAYIYQALESKKEIDLPPILFTFQESLQHMHHHLQSELIKQKQIYWTNKLKSFLPSVLLVDNKKQSSVELMSNRGEIALFEIDPSLTKELVVLTHRYQCTLYMVLLASFYAILHHYSQQEDLLIGTAVSIRPDPLVVGCFINILALRADCNRNMLWMDLLDQVKCMLIEGLQHAQVPFTDVVNALNPVRGVSPSSLFKVAFSMDPKLEPNVLNWDLNQIDFHTGYAKFDFYLLLEEKTNIIAGRIVYKTNCFTKTFINNFINNYLFLLKRIAKEPHVKILNVLDERVL